MLASSHVFYEFGPFLLQPGEHLLLRDGHPVHLTPKTFETLFFLIKNRGRLVRKDELMSHIWPDVVVGEVGLARNISTLRRALGDPIDEGRYITTVPGAGYRFVALVREERANRRDPCIAVLPFRHGSQSRNPSLGLAMADALITKLSNVGQIAVRPTSWVGQYANSEPDPIAIARALNVDFVVQGTIQQVDDRIRVIVQLLRVSNGQCMWADKLDGNFTDIFAMQDAIARHVSEALTMKLNGEKQDCLIKTCTKNTVAYEFYLRGKHFWNKRTSEGIRNAIAAFQRAIEEDPLYASAYAGLAGAFATQSYYEDTPPIPSFPRAKAAAIKALQIDDSVAEAHAVLGWVSMGYDLNWEGAERHFRRAIEIDRNDATGHHWLGLYLLSLGRFDEALVEVHRAETLDPLSPVISAGMSLIYYYGRRYDEAIRQGYQTLELDPNFGAAHEVLGMAFAQKGNYSEAIAEVDRLGYLSGLPALVIADQGVVFQLAGKKEQAQNALASLIQLSHKQHVSFYRLALLHAALGDQEQALDCLERAFQCRSGKLSFLKIDLLFDSLHNSERYADLLRRIGIPG